MKRLLLPTLAAALAAGLFIAVPSSGQEGGAGAASADGADAQAAQQARVRCNVPRRQARRIARGRAANIRCPRGPRGQSGPAGPPGPQGAQGPQGPPGAPAVSLFAQVSNDGTLDAALSQGATAAARPADGDYRVTFNRDVEDCTPVATLRLVGTANFATARAGTSAAGGTEANQVRVRAWTAAGAATNTGQFNLHVVCP